MSNLSNYIFGVAILTGLTACGTVPDKGTKMPTNPEPQAAAAGAKMPEDLRVVFLDTARANSRELLKNTIGLLVLSERTARIKDLDKTLCSVNMTADIKNLPKELKGLFEESVSYEVALGGETKSGMARRTEIVSEATKVIEDNIKKISDRCYSKFGI